MLSDYANKTEKNPTYIAYDFLDNDPLNDNSVESLTTQVELWLE